MEHLKRFFLELSSLRPKEETDLRLPDGAVFRPTRAQTDAAAQAEALGALHTLWDTAVTEKPVQRQAQHPTQTATPAASADRVTWDDDLPRFGESFRRQEQMLTAAELSRFFERDARRYGKGE